MPDPLTTLTELERLRQAFLRTPPASIHAALTALQVTSLTTDFAALAEQVKAMEKENARYRELIDRAIDGAPHARGAKGRQVWSLVGSLFGLGSTSASRLCVEFGRDPDSGEKISTTERPQ